MKAIQILKYGGSEVFEVKDLQKITPGPGQAVICLKMAGLNFIDIYQRRGTYPVTLPFTPGMEGAGIVEAIGEGVKNVKIGDRVAYVNHAPSSYATQSLVKADYLIPLPSELSFELGAAFPLQGMTAHYLLHEFRKVKAGETILIHAVAGGVGLLLAQWAKHLGARVLGTVSTEEKAKIAKDAGVDEVIIYTKQGFVAEVKRLTCNLGADLIIDGVGKTTFAGNLEAAAICGNIIIFGAASGPADPIVPNILMKKSLTLSGGTLFNYMRTQEELLVRANAVLDGIKKGWLKLRIDQVFSLDKASEAQNKLENRQSAGKILLDTAL